MLVVAVVGVVVLRLAGVDLTAMVGGPRVAEVRLDASTVDGCEETRATVTLDREARRGGATVELATVHPAATVPARVTVHAGASEAAFPVRTRPVAIAEVGEVRAALGGARAAASLRVQPVAAAALQDDPSPACLAAFAEHHGYAQPERTGSFDVEVLPEVSGLAASRRNPGWLYLVDDEEPEEVWAVRPDGSGLRALPLVGFVGRDTEDLAVGACGPDRPGTCVYVGDIGDNRHRYADVRILRFPEPDLAAPVAPVEPDVIRVRYPQGPVDAEALLVDDAGVPYIVTKQAGPDGTGAARLYAAPGFATGTLVDLGPVAVPEPALPLAAGFVGVVVTGGDYRDGRVLLRTYDHVVEYVAPDPAAPLATFAGWPARQVPAAREPQSEAVAFDADGCGYYTAGEQVGDIWYVACRR